MFKRLLQWWIGNDDKVADCAREQSHDGPCNGWPRDLVAKLTPCLTCETVGKGPRPECSWCEGTGYASGQVPFDPANQENLKPCIGYHTWGDNRTARRLADIATKLSGLLDEQAIVIEQVDQSEWQRGNMTNELYGVFV